MKIRIAGTVAESLVDGPGIRFVVFAQGCKHHCPGCHNPETHPLDGGKLTTVEELYDQIKKQKLLRGVTFSGGEPFLQASAFAQLGRLVKASGLDLVVYTGYLFEELLALQKQEPAVGELLEQADILVDGPFLLNERDLSLPYRGSRNQRIIDVKESLKQQRAILWKPSSISNGNG